MKQTFINPKKTKNDNLNFNILSGLFVSTTKRTTTEKPKAKPTKPPRTKKPKKQRTENRQQSHSDRSFEPVIETLEMEPPKLQQRQGI